MVDLSKRNETPRESLDRASRAIAEALAVGVDESDLQDMVTSVLAEQATSQLSLPEVREDGNPVFTELPDGTIDLRTASKKYGLNLGTLRTWVHTDRLKVVGRLRAPAPGGGYLIIDESDLRGYMAAPRNKGGRPRKT